MKEIPGLGGPGISENFWKSRKSVPSQAEGLADPRIPDTRRTLKRKMSAYLTDPGKSYAFSGFFFNLRAVGAKTKKIAGNSRLVNFRQQNNFCTAKLALLK